MRAFFRVIRALPRAILAFLRALRPKDFEPMLRPIEADNRKAPGHSYLSRKAPIPYWILVTVALALHFLPPAGFFIYQGLTTGWPGFWIGFWTFFYYILLFYFAKCYFRCFYFGFLQYRLFRWKFISNIPRISARLQEMPPYLGKAPRMKTSQYSLLALFISLVMASIAWLTAPGLLSNYFWLLTSYGPLMILTRFFIEARTPHVLLLGGSDPETTRLQRMLNGVFPWSGVVSLLDMEDHQHGKMLRMAFGSVRYPDADWRETFRFFADLVKVIVVDIRHLTPLVREEIQWVRESGLIDKTYLLYDGMTSREEEWIGPSLSLGAFLVTRMKDLETIDQQIEARG